jgi:hypothetical protein
MHVGRSPLKKRRDLIRLKSCESAADLRHEKHGRLIFHRKGEKGFNMTFDDFKRQCLDIFIFRRKRIAFSVETDAFAGCRPKLFLCQQSRTSPMLAREIGAENENLVLGQRGNVVW